MSNRYHLLLDTTTAVSATPLPLIHYMYVYLQTFQASVLKDGQIFQELLDERITKVCHLRSKIIVSFTKASTSSHKCHIRHLLECSMCQNRFLSLELKILTSGLDQGLDVLVLMHG